MELTFNGHACVTLSDARGRVLVTDPYLSGALDGKLSFRPVKAQADWVTISHYHIDHAYVSPDIGSPVVVDKTTTVDGMRFEFRPTYHDGCGGCRMGMTHMMVGTMDELRFAHLGDIGCSLTPEDLRFLGDVDILLWPTGGVYTLGPNDAARVLQLIRPKIAIPMHYETVGCNLGLAPIETTLAALNHPVRRRSSGTWSSSDGLPDQTEVWVLEPTQAPDLEP